MKAKVKKTIFICQIIGDILKLIKCRLSNQSKRKFVGLEVETMPLSIDDEKLPQKLNQILKRLEYTGNPLIISIPRAQSTCRHLKIPTTVSSEIEQIANLQAPRFLPYQADDLITGYQVISTDKDGYSDVNLVIVHRDLIERYIKIFNELKPKKLTIVLSSYGLVNLYNYLNPKKTGSVMIIDIGFNQVELVITSNKKLLFSRAFKLNRSGPDWEDLFISEINKSQDTYLKEGFKVAPSEIAVIGSGKTYRDFIGVLNKRIDLPVEMLSYDKINFSNALLNKILISDNSFANMVGLGLRDLEEQLNLLTPDIKSRAKKSGQRKKGLRFILFTLVTILILGLGIISNLNNKAKYLEKLRIELNKITQEAEPLEELDRRLKVIEKRSQRELSSLDILYELHQVIPTQAFLINLEYEEDGQIILRGQTPELSSVFIFISQLEDSSVFKSFNIKVRYATKRKTRSGEVIDFEITCLRK